MKKFISVLFTLLMCICVAVSLRADDHVVYEMTRTYMGRTTPVIPVEIWFSENSVATVSRGRVIIYRHDMGKRWTVLSESKRYLEEPLFRKENDSRDEFRIQDYGFDYRKSYDWNVRVTGKTEVREGKSCREIILFSEDDFSEETRVIWVTGDVPVDTQRFYDLYMKAEYDPSLLALYEKTPLLRESLLIEGVYTEEPPIAPTIVWKRRLAKAESLEPPPGIYDIPEGFRKVDSWEELYAD